jgi:hypothetical protein
VLKVLKKFWNFLTQTFTFPNIVNWQSSLFCKFALSNFFEILSIDKLEYSSNHKHDNYMQPSNESFLSIIIKENFCSHLLFLIYQNWFCYAYDQLFFFFFFFFFWTEMFVNFCRKKETLYMTILNHRKWNIHVSVDHDNDVVF